MTLPPTNTEPAEMSAQTMATKPANIHSHSRRRWGPPLVLWVGVRFCLRILGRIVDVGLERFAGDGALLFEPGAEIHQLAAFAAERPPALFLTPLDFAAAGGAGHVPRFHVQQIRVNGTSPSACLGRWSMPRHSRKRMLQRCWLPLISGYSTLPGSSTMRSSW